MTPTTAETVLLAAGLFVLAVIWWRHRQTRWTLTRTGRMSPSPSLRLPHLLWRYLAAALLALPLLMAGGAAARAAVDCPDAGLLGPGLLNNICWECIFPIRIGGGLFATGGGDIPDRAAAEPICLCDDKLGVPHIGITWGMWEPARLVELVRAPGCSPVLAGAKIEATGELQRGSRGGTLYDKGDRAFYHYHLWAFPLLAMLELFTPADCQRDAGIDMDLLYFSELDPTWIYDELAFFANPESAAVANPAAQAACIADAVAATAGEPLDQLFWCAGSWGSLYPLAGSHLTHTSMPRNTSLLAIRSLAAMHRRGLARRTMGSDALCRAQIEPFLPKTQYQLSQAYPRPEANGRHAVGESTFAWGEHRVLPAVGEDFVHLVWRWLDCCLTY